MTFDVFRNLTLAVVRGESQRATCTVYIRALTFTPALLAAMKSVYSGDRVLHGGMSE